MRMQSLIVRIRVCCCCLLLAGVWTGLSHAIPLTPGVIPPDSGAVVKELGGFGSSADWSLPGGGTAEIKQYGFYLQAGYHFVPFWQGYARVGVASLQGDENLGFSDALAEESGTEVAPFGGIGVKGRLPLGKYWTLAPQASLDYFGNYTFTRSGTMAAVIFPPTVDEVPVQEKLTFKRQLAAEADLLLLWEKTAFTLYAGPQLYWRQARLDGELTIAGDRYASDSGTVQEKGFVGAIAGVAIPLGKTTDLILEVQQRSGFGVAGGLAYLQLDF